MILQRIMNVFTPINYMKLCSQDSIYGMVWNICSDGFGDFFIDRHNLFIEKDG